MGIMLMGLCGLRIEDGPEQAVGVLDLGYLLALGLEPLDEGDHVGPANPVEGTLPEERLDEVAEELLVLPASLRRERVISGGIGVFPARRAGFEPATRCLEGSRSIH